MPATRAQLPHCRPSSQRAVYRYITWSHRVAERPVPPWSLPWSAGCVGHSLDGPPVPRARVNRPSIVVTRHGAATDAPLAVAGSFWSEARRACWLRSRATTRATELRATRLCFFVGWTAVLGVFRTDECHAPPPPTERQYLPERPCADHRGIFRRIATRVPNESGGTLFDEGRGAPTAGGPTRIFFSRAEITKSRKNREPIMGRTAFAFDAKDERFVEALIRYGVSLVDVARELDVDEKTLVRHFGSVIETARARRKRVISWDFLSGRVRKRASRDQIGSHRAGGPLLRCPKPWIGPGIAT